jgi:hypothetical protein
LLTEPVELSGEDFLDEIRIAPKYNVWQEYDQGLIGLTVYYSFAQYWYVSPSMKEMGYLSSAGWYKELTAILGEPTIKKCRV